MTTTLTRKRTTSWEHTGELPGYKAPRSTTALLQRTEVLADEINPLLADVLDRFSDLDRQFGNEAAASGGTSTFSGVADPVAAVDHLADRLGVPPLDILRGVGIAERTFHDWKNHNRKSRLSSHGQLWKLVQVVEDLGRHIEDLPTWFRSEPRRCALLREGRVDDLAAEPLRAEVPGGPSDRAGAGSGMVGPETVIDMPSRRRRQERVPVTRRSSRPGR